MAIIKGNILGSYRKRAGEVVFRRYRDLDVFQSAPKKMSNPKTNAQELVRARFRVLSKLAHDFAIAVNAGLKGATQGTSISPRNLFTKKNWGAVSATSPDNVTTDYAELVVAQGPFRDVLWSAPRFDNPLEVELTFDSTNLPQGVAAGDVEVYTFLYCVDLDDYLMKAPVLASAGSVNITVPGHWSGQKVHIWCWTKYTGANIAEQGIVTDSVSNSDYVGSGNIS